MVTFPGKIQLLVAVVQYKSKLVSPRLGLCSNWLKSLRPSTTTEPGVQIWVKPGTFRFPDPSVNRSPMIMVGPGTGIAPFRSFVTEQLKHFSNSEKKLVVFFGCRGKEKDFYFKVTGDIKKISSWLRDIIPITWAGFFLTFLIFVFALKQSHLAATFLGHLQ